MLVHQRSTGRRARWFHAPTTLEEAAGLLAEHTGAVRLAAGGTYLNLMASQGETQPDHLVSLHRIAGLDDLEAGRIGALATLQRLERWTRSGPDRALTMGAAVVAGPLIRPLATVGGNLGFADGDLAAPLLALGATAHLDDGTSLPVADFVVDRPPDRILTHVTYRPRAADGWSAATVKLARRGMDWPIVTIAVAVRLDDDGQVVEAGAAAQALAATPIVLPGVAAVLIGSAGEPEAFELAGEAAVHRVDVRDDAEASAAHRRRVAPAVAARAAALAVRAGAAGELGTEEAWR